MSAPRICIAGLGVYGAATARALARTGADVVAFDPHRPPHTRGSSHGVTRILRFAYYEHPLYVPLVRRALEGWRQLESDAGETLLRRTGALTLGPPGGAVARGVLASVREHGLAHELLEPGDVARRFPGLRARADDIAILEPDAGLLSTEACVRALLDDAVRAGADIRTDMVREWTETGDGVRIVAGGQTVEADALVLAMGPWLAATAIGRTLGLVVERQPFFWYETAETDAMRLPIVLRELEDGRIFYIAPGPGQRIKAAEHHGGTLCDPETVDRVAGPQDEARLRPLVSELLPETAARPAVDGAVCLYTNAPDGHFIVDRAPGAAHTFVLSACSGHGFKFAPAIAESLAARLLERSRMPDVGAFATARLL